MREGDVDVFHAVPDEARRIWREHFGFFTADPISGDAVLVHLAIDPVRRSGTFTLVAWVAGRRVKDIVQAPMPGRLEGLTELSTDRLHISLSEPGREARVRYSGPELALDLRFVTTAGPHRAPPAGEAALFPVDNEQQAVRVAGTLAIAGEDRLFAGSGSRDHSWGWFPEWPFAAHEWLTIVLPDRTVQLSRTRRMGGILNHSQVELIEGGSRLLAAAEIGDPYWRVPVGDHLPTLDRDLYVALTDADGRETSVVVQLSTAKSRHYSNKRDRQLHRIYEQATILASAETDDGARGMAVVELGCLLERPGVCDEPLPGTSPTPHRKDG
jgi:hypothetical protein